MRPDGQQLAVGRYDGVLMLIDAAGGKTVAEPLPPKPKPPQVAKLSPDFGPRGRTVRVTVEGQHLVGLSRAPTTVKSSPLPWHRRSP